STDELEALYPFSLQGRTSAYFNKDRWDEATRALQTLYYNNGYLYMNVRAGVTRRAGGEGARVVDLRWVLNEAQPAIINKVEIVRNEVTRERVIRDATVVLPSAVELQDAS